MFRLSSWATENYAFWVPACVVLAIVVSERSILRHDSLQNLAAESVPGHG